MNTFLAAQQEISGTNEVTRLVTILKQIPLTQRIYQRGAREQRNALLLGHYHPNAPKRLIKHRSFMIKNDGNNVLSIY